MKKKNNGMGTRIMALILLGAMVASIIIGSVAWIISSI